MIDILFLAKGRREFTTASFETLFRNTEWRDARLFVYTDGDVFFHSYECENIVIDRNHYGGPVAIMREYLSKPGAELFAKIDNDVIVPSGWLEQCRDVMKFPIDLLGIEPPESRTPNPFGGARPVPPELNPDAGKLYGAESGFGYVECDSIGGIGLMRRSAFSGRAALKPRDIYGGFTDWQLAHPEVKKAWILPPLKVFLLDRLPIEPWVSLSKQYIATGQQRPWTNYSLGNAELWNWWLGSLAGLK